MNSQFYDGTKLLSLLDANGEQPEIYICTSNRSAGKTTYWNRYAVNRFIKHKEKFIILYRYKYELQDCAEKFFGEIGSLFFQEYIMTSRKICQGIANELFLNNISCGYALAINSADQIKKFSHVFNKASVMIFDEFQSETNNYCPNEVRNFISIHTSIARGDGKQVKRLPVIMIGNPITLLNPYYVELGISTKLTDKTVFYRGSGFVLEQGYLDSASKAQQSSAFNKAFSNNNYVQYSSQAVYLNDNYAFIEKPTGRSNYIASVKYENHLYAIREYNDLGIVYCDDVADDSFKLKISLTTNDHNINYVMLKKQDMFISTLKFYFEHGCFRFKNLKCKEVILKMLSY